MSKNYIFGYGSLIDSRSRNKTGKTKRVIPARVKGIKRGWYFNSEKYGVTALGAILDKKSICNGVLIELDENELIKFDEREKGYKRHQLDYKNLILINENKISGKIWIYIIDKKGEPTKACPIVQSYLDVVIEGCLDFGDNFAEEFIKTTDAWNKYWIDDRKNPRYVRAAKNSRIEYIDSILKKYLKFSKTFK